MTDASPLNGKKVLVIEDDYYLATDQAEALRQGGATIVACTGDAVEAVRLVGEQRLDFAIVDINLGLGPTYEAASALKSRNIPFIFTTGYDAASIPTEFQDVPRLEKPFDRRRLVAAVEALI